VSTGSGRPHLGRGHAPTLYGLGAGRGFAGAGCGFGVFEGEGAEGGCRDWYLGLWEGLKAGGERRVFWVGDRCIPCCLGKTTVGNRCLLGLMSKKQWGDLRFGLRESRVRELFFRGAEMPRKIGRSDS